MAITQLSPTHNHDELLEYLEANYPKIAALLPEETTTEDIWMVVKQKRPITRFFDSSEGDASVERDFERLSMKVEAWIDEAEVLSAAASPLAEHAS